MKSTLGEKINPILLDLETAVWQHDAAEIGKIDYTPESFRAITKIFMSAMLDKMWELQNQDDMPMANREQMAESCGTELSKLIKTYTGIDTHKMYHPRP